ncbi:MAG TPA: zinc ribbon domain-containing protein [Thermoanaerobaculia bacterium]|nr:zinc ribbon domain-containing protein [Thermoanaerobaculia bacterium]
MILHWVLVLIALLVGPAMVSLVCLKRGVRRVVPKPALLLASLAFFATVIYGLLSAERQGRALVSGLSSWEAGQSVLASTWRGFAAGALIAAAILGLGYIYGDARRRGMPAVLWLLVVFMVPNLIGLLLYFLLRKPLLESCAHCGLGIAAGQLFCSHCGAPQGQMATP